MGRSACVQRVTLLLALGTVSGCPRHPTEPPPAPDLATPMDLASETDLAPPPPDLTPRTDLAPPPLDLRPPPDLAPSADLGPVCTGVVKNNVAKYVINKIFLGESLSLPAPWGYDLDGDGSPHNRYGAICSAFLGQGLSIQPDVDNAVATGTDIVLLTVRSTDATFTSDSCAEADVDNGNPQSAPDYSGNGSFTVDNSVATGVFPGVLGAGASPAPWDMASFAGGFFDSPNPATTSMPVALTVPIDLFGIVRVPLVGAHIEFEDIGPQLVTGKINGAVKNADVQSIVIPGLTRGLNQIASRVPCDARCTQVLMIFDEGGQPDSAHCPPVSGRAGCLNPDGTCGYASDGKISICEVTVSGLVQNPLEPDLQMFDGNGHYAPDPAHTTKDSWSVGFGFNAVRANF
jgi:hypothetical protein